MPLPEMIWMATEGHFEREDKLFHFRHFIAIFP